MRFVCQYPNHPWWNVCVSLVQELAGPGQGTGPPHSPAYAHLRDVQFALLTPRSMLGARNNPLDVEQHVADVGITTPTAAAVMARDGSGPFEGQACPGLRAIAAYPHDDFLLFMADRRFDTGSLTNFLDQPGSARIVTGRKDPAGVEDVLTHCVQEVIREHRDASSGVHGRGDSELVFAGPTRSAGRLLVDGQADALFHEAQGHPMWAEIVGARDMTLLAMESSRMAALAERLHLPVRDVPVDHVAANGRSVPTLDFSGWLLFVHADMSEADAYALATACDRSREVVERVIPDRSLTKPLDPESMFTHTGIPLHPGAHRYADERGYLAAIVQ